MSELVDQIGKLEKKAHDLKEVVSKIDYSHTRIRETKTIIYLYRKNT